MQTRSRAGGHDEQVRAAQNQALFREVNERLERLKDGVASDGAVPGFVCECADTACTESVGVTPAEYESVRADGSRFIVAPGEAHYLPGVERLVETHERFWVVEKFEDGGRVAARLNPRTRRRIADA